MTIELFGLNVLQTVVGGVLLTFLFFLLKEKCFSLPNVNGTWYLEIHTKKTAYRPFEGMKLRYIVMMWREGGKIEGTIEKVYELSSTGEREYVGKQRTRGQIHGSIEKRYFSKDRLCLHIVEDGHERQSSNFYDVTIFSTKEMIGVFSSMVANQSSLSD
jgi:hypothetical protein